ncbi:fibronectin type III domain-containing protein [Armatimonas sp.]|uniref:fibronectin type III domain-containing protein n=1 Tax=Armatimonas sp. TaxID=1872638 RepID=UPI00286C9D80|nr:fibronectin type III domain-containing protein [Armatimonas sp.]
MPQDYLPANDREFLAWLKNFNRVATTNKLIFAFTDDELEELTGAETTLEDAIATNDAAQSAAQAAMTAKTQAQAGATSMARAAAQRAQTSKAPDALRDAIGITVRDKVRSRLTAQTPLELVALAAADETHILKWKSGGNKSGTQYLIEAKIGESTTWTLIDVSTRVTYKHLEQPPGQKVRYRVRAKRGDSTSGYSNESGVYGG